MTIAAAASPDSPVLTAAQLGCLLACSSSTLIKHMAAGRVPRPDGRGHGNAKMWKLSTIRAWNPAVAAAAAELVTRKPIPLNSAPLPAAA